MAMTARRSLLIKRRYGGDPQRREIEQLPGFQARPQPWLRRSAPLRLLSIPTCESHFSHPAKFLPLALVCIELLLDGWLTFDRSACRVCGELCVAVFADS
jgi:hypothetical protein